jgi:predicted esterase
MARELHMDGHGRITPALPSADAPQTGQPMVLLVHGFNNDSVQAKESYFAMRRNLNNVLQFCGADESRRKEVQRSIWELYWPGYLPLTTTGPRGMKRGGLQTGLSAGGYFLQVKKARDWVPDQLSAYLREAAPSEIFFIGHSLGCRVILETIDRLIVRQNILLSGLLLMAGAVPVDFLTKWGKLRQAANRVNRRYCFYSWKDTVLSLTFPPGQLMADEQPLYGLPVATGLTGWPGRLYTGQSNTGLGHGGYWRHGIFKDQNASHETLAGIFRVASARGIGEAKLLELPIAGGVSIIPDRNLEEWRLPGDDWLDDYGPTRRQS